MFKTLIKKYNYWKTKRGLLERYRNEREVRSIMEQWITKRILEGQEGRRDELVKMQQSVKEAELMVDFLEQL